MSDPSSGVAERLNELLRESGLQPVSPEAARQFEAYLSLIIRWNSRMNLSSVRNPEGILARHFVESIACAQALPAGIATLLDFGSGAGFPGVPIALCRPEIAVTLAESQGKKAAFLQEVVRTLAVQATVYAGRAESLSAVFDCVTLRAVDKMPSAVAAAALRVAPGGWLALMTTLAEQPELQSAPGPGFKWVEPIRLPGSESRILVLGQRN